MPTVPITSTTSHGMHTANSANYTEYFAKAILDGTATSPDLEEGIDTFCVMEAVRRSAASGKPVQVQTVRDDVRL